MTTTAAGIDRSGDLPEPAGPGRWGDHLVLAGANPLAEGFTLPDPGDARVVVLPAGTLADPAEGPEAADPRNWMGFGRAALDAVVVPLARRLAAEGRRLVLLPHARHVLSDVPSCRRFLADHADLAVGVALAPAALLEPTMVGDVADHLERILRDLAPIAALAWLEDVVVAGDACRRVPLGTGILPLAPLFAGISARLPAGTPIIAPGADRSLLRPLSS